MKIESYAIARDFFGRSFEVDEPVTDIAALREWLAKKNPAAASLLKKTRFAVGDEFIDDSFLLHPADHVSIIPPSSGG
ncbi:MAG TPA: MoaD/ThiS family protein [Flavitalea sp.]|nr:MoaD/ThiS family protein [Flavitalea sp.]